MKMKENEGNIIIEKEDHVVPQTQCETNAQINSIGSESEVDSDYEDDTNKRSKNDSIDDEYQLSTASLPSNTPSIEESLASLSFNPPKQKTKHSLPAQKLKSINTPSLRKSLFSNIPPTINFMLHNEISAHGLHPDIKHLLKWKLSSISPSIVRCCVSNSGYRLMKRNVSDWVATWGKSMKPQQFRVMKEDQKVNHFPGTFHIGRKDRLWRNYRRMLLKHGEVDFNFLPRTFCLPADDKLLRKDWERVSKSLWIVKPPAKARGNGIKVISKWNQIPKTRPLLVQRYIAKPYLINQTKFDLRLYVLITSINPLRIHLYDDGLVRFASKPYSSNISTAHDVFTHLTNYSINKKSTSYISNEDSMLAQVREENVILQSEVNTKGHKWTLKALWRYFEEIGVDHSVIWEEIKDLVIKTIISGEKPMSSMFAENVKNRYSCFELFGFDILLDCDLKPWLVEVNISPSMHSSSCLDRDVKSPLAAEVFNLARYHIPNRLEATLSGYPGYDGLATMCYDTRLYGKEISTQEAGKHLTYIQLASLTVDTTLLPPVGLLDHLTPDDCRHLVVSEDELFISEQFGRIFPTSQTHKYFKFFTKPGYYNLLLSAWEQRYGGEKREEGIEMLERLCQDRYHLQMPHDVFKEETTTKNIQTKEDDNENSNLLSVPEPQIEKYDAMYLNEMQLNLARKTNKKLRTVVGKPFNVKTVSPGASRSSKLWRLARERTT